MCVYTLITVYVMGVYKLELSSNSNDPLETFMTVVKRNDTNIYISYLCFSHGIKPRVTCNKYQNGCFCLSVYAD